MPLILWDVLRTVELDPFSFPSGDSLHFRIELQQRSGEQVFRARVYRVEAFQMRPTFPDGTRESTEFVVLSDDSYTGSDHTAPTAVAALEHVLADLQRQFGAAT